MARDLECDCVVGSGGTAAVILQDGLAVKTPPGYLWSLDANVKADLDSILLTQNICRRLQLPEDPRSSGVVQCIELSTDCTRLAYLPNEDLRNYLKTFRPSQDLHLRWFIEMTQTLGYVHDRCVLVADIATRNFLVDSDLSVEMCDFTEASLLPLGSDMASVDDNGYTTQVDVGLLGATMYEVMTGDKCEFDLYKHNSPSDGRAYWTERSSLPVTKDIPFGWVIEGCWDGRFRDACSLLQALESIHL